MKISLRLTAALLSSLVAALPFVDAAPIKVMSYNTHGGNAKSDSNHCNNIAQVIHDSGADIVALNEIHNNWYSGNDWGNLSLSGDQHWTKIADRLGSLSGSRWERAYAQTWTKLSIRGTGHGIAIVSRWAFTNVAQVSLDVSAAPDGEPRKAFIVYVHGAPTPFYFVCTHLSYQQSTAVYQQRARNIRAITEAINSYRNSSGNTSAPVILAGDLNQSYNTDNADGQNALAQLRYLDWTVTNDTNPQGTFGGAIFDYISFYRNAGGMRTLSHYVIPESFSDHDPCVSLLLPDSDSVDFVAQPAAQTVANSAGTASISITAESWLPWTVSSDSAWCKPLVSSGSGSATLNFSMARNTTAGERTASITVTETATNTSKTFTISQSGPSTGLILDTVSGGNTGTLASLSSAAAGGYGNYKGFSFSTPAFASRGNSWTSTAYMTDFQFAYSPTSSATDKKFYLNIYTSSTPSASSFVGQSAIVENNIATAKDYHAGYSGIAKWNNSYTLTVPAAGSYKLRYWAEVQNEGLDSSGNITVTGTAVSTGVPTSWAPAQWTTPDVADIPEALLAQRNSWNNLVAAGNFRMFEVPVTVTTAGTISAKFVYSSGAKRLNLMGADLIATGDAYMFRAVDFSKIELQENTKYYAFFSSVPATSANYAFSNSTARLRLGKVSDGLTGNDSAYTDTNGATQSGGWLPIYKTEFASIDQEPRFEISSNSANIAYNSNAGANLAVSTNISSWTVTSSEAWLEATPASTSNSPLTVVTYKANSANPSTTSTRTGTLTFSHNGETTVFTVTQAAAPQPAITLAATEMTTSGDISTGEISISANTAWTAVKSADWISLSSGNGNGNGTITFTVTANPDNSPRTGTVTITAGNVSKTFTITQEPSVVSPILDYAENPNFATGRDFGDFTQISLVSPGAYNGFTFSTGAFTELGSDWRNIAYLTSLFYAQAHNYWNAASSNIYANIYTSANPSAATFVGQSTGTVKSHSDFRTVVANDYHAGYSGYAKLKNTYTITVPCSGQYKLRYWVDVASEGLDSTGNINVTGTAVATGVPTTWAASQWTTPVAANIPASLLSQKNTWNTTVSAGNFRMIEVPITVTTAGTISVKFVYATGNYRLNMMGVDLVPVCGEEYGRFVELSFDKVPLQQNTKYYVYFSTAKATATSYAFAAAKSRLRIGTAADGLTGTDSVFTNTSGGVVGNDRMPIYNLHISSNTAEESLVLDVPAEQLAATAQTEQVSIETNLVWAVESDVDWITFSSASGSGSSVLNMSISANTTGASRTGTVTVVAGERTETFTFTQAAE